MRQSDVAVFGDFIYKPGGRFGPRVQRDFQLVFLFSGLARIRVDGRVLTLHPGEVCLLAPEGRETFTFAPDDPTHHGWCAVRPGTLPGLPEARLVHAAAQGKVLPVSDRLGKLLELALSIPEPTAAGMVDSLALAVCEEFLHAAERDAPPDPARPPLPEPVRRARDLIDARYAEPIDLARLGRSAGVAPKYLGKLFRRHVGETPVRHLWRVRTARGAQMLTETGLTLGEIAGRVGFQNAFHFSRLIRREFGVSPRQLRAERWNPGSKPLAPRRGGGLESGT